MARAFSGTAVPDPSTIYPGKFSSPSPFTHYSLKTPLTPNLETFITQPKLHQNQHSSNLTQKPQILHQSPSLNSKILLKPQPHHLTYLNLTQNHTKSTKVKGHQKGKVRRLKTPKAVQAENNQ